MGHLQFRMVYFSGIIQLFSFQYLVGFNCMESIDMYWSLLIVELIFSWCSEEENLGRERFDFDTPGNLYRINLGELQL